MAGTPAEIRERTFTTAGMTLALAAATLLCAAGCGGKKASHADTTPPTPPAGANLSVTSAGISAVTIGWAAATDDVSAPAALQYRAFTSTSDNISTLSDIDANGTPLGNFAPGVTTTTATALPPQSTFWFNVIVRDEAGNRAAYTAVQATTLGSPCTDAAPSSCLAPTPGKMSVCGRLYDAGSNAPIEASTPTGNACTAVSADGPCSLRIQFFDAISFATNPAGATPIVPGTLSVDDCGRFQAHDIAPPGGGYLSIAVDDAPTTSASHRLSAVMTPTSPATQPGLAVWVTTTASDAAWSSSAGLSGQTFAQRGVLALVFRYQGLPRGGVQVRRAGAPIPADDSYFSDVDAARTTVDAALTVTGSNGTALVINGASPANYDGTGNEPSGCTWPSAFGATIAGVVSFQPLDAKAGGGGACP